MTDKTVNLNLDQAAPPALIHVTQGDTSWRWHFPLYLNGARWTIPTGAIAILKGVKPDGHVFAYTASIASNEAVVDAQLQMTVCAGPVGCTLILIDAAYKRLHAAKITLLVAADPEGSVDVASDSALPAYAELLSEYAELDLKAAAAMAAAEEALAFATAASQSAVIGEINGLATYIRNKKIAIFGDSISDENLSPTTYPAIYNVWVNRFRQLVQPYGATVVNYSVHGFGFVKKTNDENITTRIANADLTNIDTIIIFGGINDFFSNVPFGKAMDGSNADGTFWKSLKQIGDKLRGKSVFVVTPLQTTSKGGLSILATAEMYRVALKNFCNGYGFKLINGTTVPGFYKYSPFYADNVHPKNEYSYLIADYIFQKIIQGGEAFNPYIEIVRKDFEQSEYYSSASLQVYVDGDSVNYVFSMSGLTGIPQSDPLTYDTITLSHYFMQTAAFTNGSSFGYVISSLNEAGQKAGGIGGSMYTGTIATGGYAVFQITGTSPCLSYLGQTIV